MSPHPVPAVLSPFSPPQFCTISQHSDVVCHMSRPTSPRSTSQYRTLSGPDRALLPRCVLPIRFACFLPPFGFPFLPVLVSASCARSRVVRFRSLPLSRVEVRSYRSARASGAPLVYSVPTDLLHPSLFMGDPGLVPGGAGGAESLTLPPYRVTMARHTTPCWRRIRFFATRNTLALSSLLPLRLTETCL